jgi:DNA-binding winged helix-turn-helix (wHTH) protein/tetratricopeptide (TPR) repeat protein
VTVVRFGSFVFDVTTGELTRQGRRVALQDQPARVLAELVTRAGRLVTRDDLRQALWPEDTFVEFETAIAVAINKIRRALGDSATSPRFVETVPKHGYRFLADVHAVTVDAAAAAHIPPRQTAPSPGRLPSAWMLAMVASMIVAAVGAGAVARRAPVPREIAAHRSTANIDAYRWYLQGRWHMDRRTLSDLHAATAAFRQATEADSTFAPAYAWLANAYGMLGYLGAIPPVESASFTVASANRALQLDDRLAEGQFAYAGALAFFQWRWTEADAAFRKALALDPNYAEGHHWYAVYLQNVGRMDVALAERHRANDLDPRSSLIALGMGDYFVYAREPERALGQAEQLLRRNPSLSSARTLRGAAYVQLGQFDQAVVDLDAAHQSSPDSPYIAAWLASAFARAGADGEARRLVEGFVTRAQTEYVSPFEIGMMYAAINDRDQSFRWLMKACDIRDPRLTMIRATVRSDGLRADPRFETVLGCVGLPPLPTPNHIAEGTVGSGEP